MREWNSGLDARSPDVVPTAVLVDTARAVIRVHHAAVRQSGGQFMRAVQAVAASLEPQSITLVHRYDRFAKRLAATLVELEGPALEAFERAVEERTGEALEVLGPLANDLSQVLASHHAELAGLEQTFPLLAESLHQSVQAFADEVNAALGGWREVLRGPLAPWLSTTARG